MIRSLLKLLRPTHWLKNGLIFVPLIFSLSILDTWALVASLMAFISFSLMASTIYVINDYLDIERDRSHPTKKNRPLASGKVSKSMGLFLALVCCIFSLLIALQLPTMFIVVLAIYTVLNLSYSLYLKHIVLIDLLIVAACYLLRVYAGAKAIGVPITSWLLFITFFLALFIISGKRFSEISHHGAHSRPVLAEYTDNFLATIMNISATGVIVFYALYTTTKNFLFGYSIIFIIFALFRILYWTQVKKSSEEPEKLFIKDPWLAITILLWAILSGITLYYPSLVP
jgi:decaprenyl-phosphate phosphoribosyltransferase